jgi:hypothetical protein
MSISDGPQRADRACVGPRGRLGRIALIRLEVDLIQKRVPVSFVIEEVNMWIDDFDERISDWEARCITLACFPDRDQGSQRARLAHDASCFWLPPVAPKPPL